jgi:hypothetical protein
MSTYIFTFREDVDEDDIYGNRNIKYKIAVGDGAHFKKVAEQFGWFLSSVYGYQIDVTANSKEQEDEQGE